MRILLILIIIAAVFVVVQAQRHGCKYDATLIDCVLKGTAADQPTAETPAPAPEPAAPEAPAPAPETPAPPQ
jgi:hypothetical protein